MSYVDFQKYMDAFMPEKRFSFGDDTYPKIKELDLANSENSKLNTLHENKSKEIENLVAENEQLDQLLDRKIDEINQLNQIKYHFQQDNEKLNDIVYIGKLGKMA